MGIQACSLKWVGGSIGGTKVFKIVTKLVGVTKERTTAF